MKYFIPQRLLGHRGGGGGGHLDVSDVSIIGNNQLTNPLRSTDAMIDYA